MTDDLRNRLRRRIQGTDVDAVQRAERPQMLDFRPTDGSRLALPYLSLRRVEFSPDEQPPLTIEFSSHTITIDGTQLETAYLAVITQSVLSLIERSPRGPEPDDGDVVVESLRIERKGTPHARDEVLDD